MAVENAKDFIIDYCGRHKHPVNAVLHIFGVPMVFYGLFKLFDNGVALGLALIVAGYFLQWAGHRAQGNEVGEVILIKKIARKLFKSGDTSESGSTEVKQ